MRYSEALELLRSSPEQWDIFTSKDEYGQPPLDKHGRFSPLDRKDEDRSAAPISRFLSSKGFRPEYPNGKKFAVVLTHDVDSIYPTISRSAISAARCIANGDLSNALDHLTWRFGPKASSPYRRFRQIMSLEEKYEARSTFFFMASGPDRTGAGYSLDDVSSDIRMIADRGWEVGLHGGYDAYLSPSTMIEEKTKLENILGRQIQGYRNHYLRFRTPDSWKAIRDAGFQYDSTFGHAACWGFRNGTALPFRPVDRVSGGTIDLVELPLALMDTTLYGYAKIDAELSWEITNGLIDEAKAVGGCLVVLWHNDTFGNPKLDQWSKLYERLLSTVKKENGWLCSAGQAAGWCRSL